MKLTDIISIINNIERTYNVTQWKVGDVYIWPILRIEIGKKIIKRNQTKNKSKIIRIKNNNIKRFLYPLLTLVNIVKIIPVMIKSIFDSANGLYKYRKADVLFFANHYSRIKLIDKYYDKLIEPLAELLEETNKTFFCVERANGIFKSPRSIKSLIIDLKIELLKIKAELELIFKKSKYEIIIDDSYYDFHNFLNESFDINIDINHLCFQLVNFIKYFNKITNFIKPKVFICTNYPRMFCMSGIYVCNKKGIPTVDVQHGVQGKAHLSYSQWSMVPQNGYKLLPKYYFVWSEEEKKVIEKWGLIYGYKAYVIGNLFLDKWLNNMENKDPIVSFYDYKIHSIMEKYKTSYNILYSMSDELPPDIVLDFISKNEEFTLWIRMHPKRHNMKNDVLKLIDGMERVVFMAAIDLPLYSILRNIDFNITSYSSVALEAVVLKKQTIIVNQFGNELYYNYISTGQCIFAETSRLFNKAAFEIIDRNKLQYSLKQKLAMEFLINSIESNCK